MKLTAQAPTPGPNRLRSRVLDVLFRVFDPRVVQRDETLGEALFDPVQFGEREAALLELPVQESFHEQLVDQFAQASGGGGAENPAGALHLVGEHDDAGLTAVR